MNQRIYDSKRQELLDLDPVNPGEVGLYVCGPTVQSAPHIGHLRSALVYDQIRRWFEASGYRVTLIRNVTDIDDKILDGARAAAEAGSPEEWWALAYRVERDFTAAYDAIGVLPPTYEPRATANIQEMIDLIAGLIERGHAYPAEDGSGSVYFDTGSWPDYGALTRQSREQMEDAADSEPVGKRDPRDFALWKAHREHEPLSASWDSPWGRGRPGWHIECSAMSTRYLGDEFDIHGGGLDLRFPHHENELAQSNAAGHPFARLWIHNGLVNTGGQKMSKSLGNSLFADQLLALERPIVLRYFLGSAHYRSELEYSETSLIEARAAFGRIEGFMDRAKERGFVRVGFQPLRASSGASYALRYSLPGKSEAKDALPDAFAAAMNDDFSVPQALAVLHQTVRDGNSAIEEDDSERVVARYAEVTCMLDILGINPHSDAWHGKQRSNVNDAAATALEALVQMLVEQRAEARAAKDFATSDKIRDRLQNAGVALEDSPNGTRWSLT